MNDLISVIVPVYNTAPYLKRCLHSILTNTYTDLEIICVDDGSTDDSLTILNEFAASDTRIKVIHQENRGVSAARNRALDIATGEWIAFVDSDDWIHNQYFELLFYAQIKTGADIVICREKVVTHFSEAEVCDSKQLIHPFSISLEQVINNAHAKSYISGRLYKCVLTQNIRFAEEVKLGEDKVYNLQVCCKSQKTVIIDNPLYYYYMREDSAVHTLPHREIFQTIEAYLSCIKSADAGAQPILLKAAFRAIFAFRYLSMYETNQQNIHKKCKDAVAEFKPYLFVLSKRDRFIYMLLYKFPALYRLYRICGDKTMLTWEKNEKRKQAAKRWS